MLKEGINGFCMALADSVPGVSGGTVAFIMGFYDRFIGSIHDLVFGKWEEKRSALFYLAKLGVGWVVGMLLAVTVLSALFESHIYAVSSLFFGFVFGAVSLVVEEEVECLRKTPQNFIVPVCHVTQKNAGTWRPYSREGNAVEIQVRKSDYKEYLPAYQRCGGIRYTNRASGI